MGFSIGKIVNLMKTGNADIKNESNKQINEDESYFNNNEVSTKATNTKDDADILNALTNETVNTEEPENKEEKRSEEELKKIKEKVFREDGSINIENVKDMYGKSEMTFEDFAQVCEAEIKEDERGKSYFETSDGSVITKSGINVIPLRKNEHDIIEGKEQFKDEDGLTIKNSEGKTEYVRSPKGEEFLAEYAQKRTEAEQMYEERQAKLKEYKEVCFDADGSLNLDNTKELFESGKITILEFIEEICEASEKYKDKSDNYDFVLADGTKVSGNGDPTLGNPKILIVKNDGEAFFFEEMPKDN